MSQAGEDGRKREKGLVCKASEAEKSLVAWRSGGQAWCLGWSSCGLDSTLGAMQSAKDFEKEG